MHAGNGYISTDVLKEILRELDNKLTEEDLDNIVDEVDEDSSGTLDFDGTFMIYHWIRLRVFWVVLLGGMGMLFK